MPYATVGDVAAVTGASYTLAQQTQLTALLDEAEAACDGMGQGDSNRRICVQEIAVLCDDNAVTRQVVRTAAP